MTSRVWAAVVAFAAVLPSVALARSPYAGTCDSIAALANENRLEPALQRWDVVSSVPPSVSTLFGGVTPAASTELDLDGDGTPERVYRSRGSRYIFDADFREKPWEGEPDVAWDELGWDLRVGFFAGPDLLRFRGRNYQIGRQGNALSYVVELRRDRRMKVVCRFLQRERRVRTLVSSGSAVCQPAMKRALERIPFDVAHSIATDRDARWETPDKRAARSDIDGDGHSDLLLPMLNAINIVCPKERLAVLDDSGTRVLRKEESATAASLARIEQSCLATLRPVLHEGRTYIERWNESEPAEDNGLFEISNGQVHEVCRIAERVVNYEISPYEAVLHDAAEAGEPPWVYALQRPGVRTVATLYNGGLDPRHVEAPEGEDTLLSVAIEGERFDIVDWLLDHGLNVRGDHAALEGAIARERPELVLRLAAQGADLSPFADAIDERMERQPGAWKGVAAALKRQLRSTRR